LRKAWEDLAGEARFRSTDGELDFTVRFAGGWTLTGSYKASYYHATTLIFELEGDQSYLNETLKQLAHIVATHGDNRGIQR
jgi:hypothetical protein